MKNDYFVRDHENYLTIPSFTQLNDSLIVGFSTKIKGYSIEPYSSLNLGLHVQDDPTKVISNRNKLAYEIGIPLQRWVFAEQVHGGNIKKVFKADQGSGAFSFDTSIKNCDGLYTNDRNVLLASLYADCVPLYFYSPESNMIGLAHAGWKGTVANIGQTMIKRWTEHENVPLHSIYVAIGPSISQQAYEVDDYVINKINNIVPYKDKLPYKQVGNHKYLLDLKRLNAQLLKKIGINEKQIFISNYCTFSNRELFYSYRRNSITGRMMSFICQS